MAVKRCVASIDVIEAAKVRIRNVFRNGLPVYMSFSGGKDSLCLSQLIMNLIQAGEIDPGQLTVQFIDEEAIFPCMEEKVKEWRKKFMLVGAKFELQMFSVRERRLMQRIQQYKEVDEKNHGLAVKSVSKKKVVEDVVNSEGEPIGGGEFKKSSETTVTNTEAVINSIMALEAELTKVQRAKTKAIEALSRLRTESQKLENEEAGNDIVKTWAQKVLEARRQRDEK